jgi:hypothetical protein
MHILADKSWVAGVQEAEPVFGVVDENVIRMVLEPNTSGRNGELGLRLVDEIAADPADADDYSTFSCHVRLSRSINAIAAVGPSG